MKHLSISLLVIVLYISGCASASITQPVDAPPDTAVTSPPEDAMPPSIPEKPPFSPQPGDDKFTRGNVYINSADLLIRESFPPQISLGIAGDLPTPCHRLRVEIGKPDSDNKISVDVYSVSDSQRVCAQVLKPFEEYIDLGTFPTGHYTVWVNGEQIGEFDT